MASEPGPAPALNGILGAVSAAVASASEQAGQPAGGVGSGDRFVADTLPRNANGKILKRELGALFADR